MRRLCALALVWLVRLAIMADSVMGITGCTIMLLFFTMAGGDTTIIIMADGDVVGVISGLDSWAGLLGESLERRLYRRVRRLW